MLAYVHIGIIIGINLLLYLIITLPLDLMTYRREESTRKKKIRPKAKQDILSTLTYLSSLTVWVLFILIPFEQIFESNFFYYPLGSNLGFYGICIQFIGILLISVGTVVAVVGRLSRGKRAFSWGIPIILETGGMYKYIRHPLYASYCYYFLGFLLVLQNPLLLLLLLGIPGYVSISKYEEEILRKYFEKEYGEYQKKTKRFIPFIW